MIGPKDRETIRSLAGRWMELANLPVMAERKRLWKAVHDLCAERPVILVETCMMMDEYMPLEEIRCEDPFLRNVERNLRTAIRHAEEIGDDIVLEPYFRLAWEIEISDYGVSWGEYHATDGCGRSVAYSYKFPIATPGDFRKLRIRTKTVQREKTMRLKAILEETMGDVLPVRVGNNDQFVFDSGCRPWTGMEFIGLTMDLFKLIGNNNLLYWVYDEPETIHQLMAFLRDDRIAYFRWLEEQGLLDVNTDNQMAGPCTYGYVTGLPGLTHTGTVGLKDLWGWAESQETTMISPAMFGEFFLPYIAEVASLFGLAYYGCCERVDDRFEHVKKAIPNLRSVSVSGWNDFQKMGELLGRDYVYSRKPTPAYISGENPNWDLVRADMEKTRAAANHCNLEILFRDIYTMNFDRPRLARWVEMTKGIFGL
jgi:hypothetical protein